MYAIALSVAIVFHAYALALGALIYAIGVARGLTEAQKQYGRGLIRELWNTGRYNTTELGKAVGVHQTGISAMLASGSNRGMEERVIVRAAELLGRSHKEVARVLGYHPSVLGDELPMDKYLGRAKAVAAARILGLSEEAIKRVLSISPAKERDPGELWWFDRIRKTDEELRDPYLHPQE